MYGQVEAPEIVDCQPRKLHKFIVKLSRGTKLDAVLWCCKYRNKSFSAVTTSSSATHLLNEQMMIDESKKRPTSGPRRVALKFPQAAVTPIPKPTGDALTTLLINMVVSERPSLRPHRGLPLLPAASIVQPALFEELVPGSENIIRHCSGQGYP